MQHTSNLSKAVVTILNCGWYYGNLDWESARNLLKETSIGIFLLRDSGDSTFSLSVQTERGPTSIRLHNEHGYYLFDCGRQLDRYMPRFKCIIELVLHYIGLGYRGIASTVWVDGEGYTHSPIIFRSPLRKGPPSLKHSVRLAIHKHLESYPPTPKTRSAPKHRQLPLPSILIGYLEEYPYPM